MKSSLRLHNLLDELPAMVAYWDRDLINRYGNKAYLDWFGIAPQKMLGIHISKLLGEDLYALNLPYLEAVLKGKPQTFERALVDASGSHRHSLAHYIPDVADDQVCGFFVLVTDVTEIRRIKDALNESQRIGKLGSWVWDANKDATEWSPQLYRLFGRDPRLPAPSYDELARYYTPESWAVHNEGVTRILETGEPYELEMEFIREDGSHGWLLANAQVIHDDQGAIAKLQGTAQDITERKHIQSELLASRNSLRDMVAHHETACEEERKHLAREVHDELGQLLTALRLDMALLGQQVTENTKAQALVEDMRQLVDKMSKVARGVVTTLRPAALDAGLLPALEWLAQDFSQRTGIQCQLNGPRRDPTMRDTLASVIFRIAQESLTNVARHAGATQVLMTLSQSEHRLTLTVQDNGCGFDMAARRPEAGFGLLSMTERAMSLGGQTRIESTPGSGTSITIEVPM